MLIFGGWGARDSDLRYTRNVFSQPHGFSCIDYISVFIRRKNPQKLLKNWDYKPAEVPKSDFQEREDPPCCCAKQLGYMGSTGQPPKSPPEPRTSPQAALSPPARDQGPGGGCSVSPHQALGLGEDAKGAKNQLNPPASAVAPGGGRQEMPREERHDQAIRERIRFAAGLVSGESTGRCRGGEAAAPGGKALARG